MSISHQQITTEDSEGESVISFKDPLAPSFELFYNKNPPLLMGQGPLPIDIAAKEMIKMIKRGTTVIVPKVPQVFLYGFSSGSFFVAIEYNANLGQFMICGGLKLDEGAKELFVKVVDLANQDPALVTWARKGLGLE